MGRRKPRGRRVRLLGLIAYAFAAAGLPHRPSDGGGLQQLAQPITRGAGLRPGDLVFVGAPAHHVGLVVAPGLAVEAPHRGAQVHVEPLRDGNWTSAGRLLPPASPDALRRRRAAVPAYVPAPSARSWLARHAPSSCRLRSLPPSSRPRADSTPGAVSAAGAQGIAQFMPGTWAGAWNPHRVQQPVRAAPAIAAQARLMHDLLERSGGDIATALAAYNAGRPCLPRIGRGRRAPTSSASCGASADPQRLQPP